MLLWTEIAIYGRRSAHAPWLAVYRQAFGEPALRLTVDRDTARVGGVPMQRLRPLPDAPSVEVFTDHDDEYLE